MNKDEKNANLLLSKTRERGLVESLAEGVEGAVVVVRDLVLCERLKGVLAGGTVGGAAMIGGWSFLLEKTVNGLFFSSLWQLGVLVMGDEALRK